MIPIYRQATVEEITSAGFVVERGQARSNRTGTWYKLSDFLVSNRATIDGEQQHGLFIYLDDNTLLAERLLKDISTKESSL